MHVVLFKGLQIDTTEFSKHRKPHCFPVSSLSSAAILRVAQEISSMAASLPLEFSSAIFLRTDDDQPNNIQVLITGPEDTPYTGGCFLFDLNFPGDINS